MRPDPVRPDVTDSSVGQLISEVTSDLSKLMRQELELAKAEVKHEATKSGKALGMLGGAGFAGYMVALFLSHRPVVGPGQRHGRGLGSTDRGRRLGRHRCRVGHWSAANDSEP